jgi:hypothetical protein
MYRGAGAVLKVKGIYDGKNVRLLEALPIPPETEVEVIAPDASDLEEEYWRRLRDAGLVRERRSRGTNERDFTPIRIEGEPLSQTVIDNRR